MTGFPESILITGGAGFVGGNIAVFLKTRHPHAQVISMDNLHRPGSQLNLRRLRDAGVEFIQGDIRFEKNFPAGPFECIVECSAEPSVLAGYSESPDYLIETNFLGTYRCLEKARLWKSRILFLSTSRIYPIALLESHPWVEKPTRFEWTDVPGSPISSQGVSEDCPVHGARSLYGLTKFASEGLIEEYRQAFGLQAVINRCSVIAGPWQMGKVDQGVVALWVLRHYFGKPLTYIGYGGTGKQVRDVLHVDDLCELVNEQLLNFDAWEGWLGNVGGGLNISASLQELTSICQAVVGKNLIIASEPTNRQADLRLFLADCSRLYAKTQWRPRRDAKQIVTDIFNWVRDQERELKTLV